MKKIKLFALLFILFCANSQAQELNAPSRGTQDKVSKPWIFNYNFKEALYKTDMSFYGMDLSGLMFIKKTDTSYHVVLLSELGLKYLDMELFTESGDVSINYSVDFLSKEKIINSFKELFQILFVIFPEFRKDYTFQCNGLGNMIRVIKSEDGEFSYRYYLENGRVFEVLHHKFLKKNASVEIPIYELSSPSEIDFQDGKIKMHLQQVEK